jgi:hypothetical protein
MYQKVAKLLAGRTQEGQLQNNELRGCISPRHQGVDWINCAHYRGGFVPTNVMEIGVCTRRGKYIDRYARQAAALTEDYYSLVIFKTDRQAFFKKPILTIKFCFTN